MAFDPSEARMRAGWHPAGREDEMVHANLVQHRFSSESLAMSMQPITDESINPGGQESSPTRGKFRVDGATFSAHLEPQGQAYYWAQLQRRAATPVDLESSAAWEHLLGPGQTDVDLTTRRLIAQVYRDDDAIANLYNGVCSQAQFQVSPDSRFDVTYTTMFARSDYWGPSVQTAGASTDPIIRGIQSHAEMLLGADGDLEIQAVVPSAGAGDFDILVTKAGDVQGATAIEVTAGQWVRIVYSDDASEGGSPPSYLELYWPDATGVANGDTWTIVAAVSTPWADARPDVVMLPETMCDIYIDGVIQNTGSPWTSLQGTVVGYGGAQLDAGVGGVWPLGVYLAGKRQVNYQVEKRYVDASLRRRLESFTAFHLDVRANTRVPIGATAEFYGMRLVSPKVILDGDRPTVTDPDSMTESYNLRAYEPDAADAEGFADDLSVVLTNALSTLA